MIHVSDSMLDLSKCSSQGWFHSLISQRLLLLKEANKTYAKAYTAIVHPPGTTNQTHIYAFMQPFPRTAVSLGSFILHFRMESQKSWQLTLPVFKTPVSLMTIFWNKILYPEYPFNWLQSSRFSGKNSSVHNSVVMWFLALPACGVWFSKNSKTLCSEINCTVLS